VGVTLHEMLPEAFNRLGRKDVAVRLVLTRKALGIAKRTADDLELLTRAGLKDLRTNDDLSRFINFLVSDPGTKGIVMAAAVCDFLPTAVSPSYTEGPPKFGLRTHPRLRTDLGVHSLTLEPAPKLLQGIRTETHKGIFLVGFKTTAGVSRDVQFLQGLKVVKDASANLVLANDLRTRLNMVVTPEQAAYGETTDREAALRELCDLIALRSNLTFTHATVLPGNPVSWDSVRVPDTLRQVVDHCIRAGAYKPFRGATVGHFAVNEGGRILTSRRKTNFNELGKIGLVAIEASGDDTVVAYGGKPSVGGQSQRIVFTDHPEMDCIVHFHCPQKRGSFVPVRDQRPYECGSHECGRNTSNGLQTFVLGDSDTVSAVMLRKHGPNIVFNRWTDPDKIISFIEEHFDLHGRTDDVQLSTEEVAREYAAVY
jgi:hypothetical protein